MSETTCPCCSGADEAQDWTTLCETCCQAWWNQDWDHECARPLDAR